MKTAKAQSVLKAAVMEEADSIRPEHLFSLIEQLSGQIARLEEWLKKKAESSPVQLLQTQMGVGYLTALVTVNTLGEVTRFKYGQ